MIASMLKINTVSATETTTQDIVNVSNPIITGYETLLRYAGLLIDAGITNTRNTLSFVKDRLVTLGFFQSTPTDEEVQQFFDDNITVSPHSNSHHNVTYSPDMVVYVENEIQAIMSTAPYFYAYSCNVKLRATDFNSGDKYRAWNEFISTYQNEYYIFKVGDYFYLYPLTNDIAFVYSSPKSQYAYVFGYDYNEWDQIKWSDMYKCFLYNDSTHEFTEVQSPHGTYAAGGYVIEDYNSIDGQPVVDSSFQWIVSFGKNIVIKVYRTINDMKESNLGISPYYITDSYNNFSNTSGSYNTTTTDNSVTYGDVTNYINNYYGDNGKYPTPEDIKIQIEIIQSGGAGGGSGGSGGDSGDLGIFDFLSRIGQVLGNLIKNLGNVLAELVEGLAETVNSLFASIPQVFSAFMEGVFGWLPSELLALITLGISAMILVGIIKIFKG